MSISKVLTELATTDLSDREEQWEKAYELKSKGIPVKKIAEHFSVTPPTIYNWLDKYIQSYRKRLEKIPAADIITEHIKFYDDIEQMCLYEANLIGIDESDGSGMRKNLRFKSEKVKFINAATSARQAKIDLQVKTGVIPKQPERIYHQLDSNKVQSDDLANAPSQRSQEEIAQSILTLVERGRKL